MTRLKLIMKAVRLTLLLPRTLLKLDSQLFALLAENAALRAENEIYANTIVSDSLKYGDPSSIPASKL